MFEDIKYSVETPCIVVDRSLMLTNLKDMQKKADAYGVKLRPHIKTHKIPEYAQLQVSLGANGITCAKVSEAEVMANNGIDDIFIAYPQVGEKKLGRVIELNKKIKRLIVGIDSFETATMLSNKAKKENVIIEVRLEVDTGVKRTGVEMEDAVSLALSISKMPNLNLTGIYTFKSLVLNGQVTEDNLAAGKEEGEMLFSLNEKLKENGIYLRDISAGSTPTGLAVASTGLVTEIRPGTYIYNDYMLTKEHWTDIEHIAVRILATVVSVSKDGKYAVVDGGTKTFPTDVQPCLPPFYYPGFAVVESNADLVLRRMYEEHGIIESATGGKVNLSVGDVLSFIPNHVCTAINLQNFIYEYDEGKIRKINVEARGMLV